MKITTLKIDFFASGNANVTMWVECATVADLDRAAAFLKIARTAALAWEREARAPARPDSVVALAAGKGAGQ